jgi:hypothetical protein
MFWGTRAGDALSQGLVVSALWIPEENIIGQ